MCRYGNVPATTVIRQWIGNVEVRVRRQWTSTCACADKITAMTFLKRTIL